MSEESEASSAESCASRCLSKIRMEGEQQSRIWKREHGDDPTLRMLLPDESGVEREVIRFTHARSSPVFPGCER